MAKNHKIVIHVEGGCLRSVYASLPLSTQGVEVTLFDFDDLQEEHDDVSLDSIWQKATKEMKVIW